MKPFQEYTGNAGLLFRIDSFQFHHGRQVYQIPQVHVLFPGQSRDILPVHFRIKRPDHKRQNILFRHIRIQLIGSRKNKPFCFENDIRIFCFHIGIRSIIPGRFFEFFSIAQTFRFQLASGFHYIKAFRNREFDIIGLPL